MNLSMEDRGLLEGQVQAPAGSRYLSGDIRQGDRRFGGRGLGLDGSDRQASGGVCGRASHAGACGG
jgi:hypothetical protein